jgi:hypothetical protein
MLTKLRKGVYAPLDQLCKWTESNLEELKSIWASSKGIKKQQ